MNSPNQIKTERAFQIIACTAVTVPLALLLFFNIESFTPTGYENDIFEATELFGHLFAFAFMGSPIISIPLSIFVYVRNSAQMTFPERKRIKNIAICSIIITLLIFFAHIETVEHFIATTDKKCDYCGADYMMRIDQTEYCSECILKYRY